MHESMRNAVSAVRNGVRVMRVALLHNVPEITLRRRLENSCPNPYDGKPIFTRFEEERFETLFKRFSRNEIATNEGWFSQHGESVQNARNSRVSKHSCSNRIKIGFPPWGFGYGFSSLLRSLISGTLCKSAARMTGTALLTAEIALRIFSCILYREKEIRKNCSQTSKPNHNKRVSGETLGLTG